MTLTLQKKGGWSYHLAITGGYPPMFVGQKILFVLGSLSLQMRHSVSDNEVVFSHRVQSIMFPILYRVRCSIKMINNMLNQTNIMN